MKYWKPVLIAMAYFLASPFLFLWGGVRFVRYLRVLQRAAASQVQCPNCHYSISLVGLWQCQCGFTYRGHLMKPCLCGRVPRVARCPRCQVTAQLR